MTNVYTQPIQEGEVATIPQLVVNMYDNHLEFVDASPIGVAEAQAVGSVVVAKTTEPRIDFHAKKLEEDSRELGEVIAWDAETAESEANKDHLVNLKSYLQRIQEERASQARFEALQTQLEAWDVSANSLSVRKVKKYTGESLANASNILYLCEDPLNSRYQPERLSGEEFRRHRLGWLAHSIYVHQRDLVEAVTSTVSSNAEIRELANSLNALSTEQSQPEASA